ncbi:MAG: sugar ABC transporter permease, partial [Methylobacteriaceae bacterium]|nr:sugar ABC transporter permease [Methylobacteriaceae bacterium]
MLASFGARRQVFFALLGLPALAYVAVVAIWPLLQGLWYSFFHYNLVRPGQFR